MSRFLIYPTGATYEEIAQRLTEWWWASWLCVCSHARRTQMRTACMCAVHSTLQLIVNLPVCLSSKDVLFYSFYDRVFENLELFQESQVNNRWKIRRCDRDSNAGSSSCQVNKLMEHDASMVVQLVEHTPGECKVPSLSPHHDVKFLIGCSLESLETILFDRRILV